MEPTRAPSGQPIITIVGHLVALGPPGPELLPLVHRWSNDFEVRMLLGADLRPVSFEASKERFERALKDETKATFCIYERSTLRPIGTTALEEIDRVHRAAEFDIRIGEKDRWGKGYGTETTRLMLDYGFTVLGLHIVRLVVVSYNERAIRAYTRAGFKLAGRIREARRVDGRAYDLIQMDCLATEFAGSMLQSLLPKT